MTDAPNDRLLIVDGAGRVATIEKRFIDGAPAVSYAGLDGRITAYSFPTVDARDAAFVEVTNRLREAGR